MPPAYEVLLLNTAIPQIQAAQAGDTYVVPRDIAINATAIISANSATDALRITQTGAGNALVVEDSANPDATPFVVTAAGDVGIGTSSPDQKLQIAGGAGSAWLHATNTANSDGTYVGTASSGEMNLYQAGIFPIVFHTASTLRMTLDSSGNLGIGTSSPNNKLTVQADATGAAFADNGVAQIIARGNTNTAKRLGLGIDTTNNVGVIQAQLVGTGNYPLALNPAGGDVGIGTTSPAYKLDVSGQVRALESGTGSGDGGLIGSTGSANGNAGVLFQTNATSRWNLTTQGTDGANLRFYNYALASTVATFDSSGNLGIGETSPGAKLEVAASGSSQQLRLVSTGNSVFRTRWIDATTGFTLESNNTTETAYYPFTLTGSVLRFNTGAGSLAMTLDASGNLVVGGTSANVGVWNKAITLNTASGNAAYELTVAGSAKGFFAADASNVYLQSSGAIPLIFTTNGSERARITSSGDLLVGVTSISGNIYGSNTGRLFVSSPSAGFAAGFRNSSASGTIYGIGLQYSGQAPNGSGNEFLLCEGPLCAW